MLSAEEFAAKHGPAFLLVAQAPDEDALSPVSTVLTMKPSASGPPVAAMFLSMQALALAPAAGEEGPLSLAVGRSSDSQVILPFASVSKRHAVLSRASKAEPWRIEDTGSKFGTHVNGRRLLPGERRDLANGAALSLGDVQLIFRHTESFQTLLKVATEMKRRNTPVP